MKECPSCNAKANYQMVKDRRSYQCSVCANQVYPTAGTVFEKTTTPLTYWFYTIYLYTTTRNGVAAKELKRQLSVCYKTALRMAHQIKILMMDNNTDKLCWEIIMDESFIGGLPKNMHHDRRAKIKKVMHSSLNKTIVWGMLEKKDGGKVVTQKKNQQE